jgi:CHASE2 domain-containing sensor protein
MDYGMYVLDYSLLNQIRVIRYRKPGELDAWRDDIDSRVVFIGDTENKADMHVVPGRYDRLPGVLIHANAYATLNRGLLWYVDSLWSHIYDGAIVVFVILLSGVAHWRNRLKPEVDEHAGEILVYLAAAVFTVAVSTWFIGYSRIFWSDFLWISVALLLHPYMKQVLAIVAKGTKGFVREAGRPEHAS